MDPISALGLAASVIAVIQMTKSILKSVGPSALNKLELNRLLSLASGFKGAYEALEYRLEYSENDDSRAALLKHLEEPVKECKLVLECIRERLENVKFIQQYIVGSHFDKKLKRCMERLKDEKELFELVMQVDQHVMLREIKKFSQKTEEIIILVQNSAEETRNSLENLAKLTREHHEDTRAYFDKAEGTLDAVNATILAQKSKGEEKQREENQKAIICWLSNTDHLSNHFAAKKKHESTTGNWFTKGDTYKQWLANPGSFLWLHGIPGCGKSVLCSTIIDETKTYCSVDPSQDSQVAYYYFSFTDKEKQKPGNCLRSIIAQLVSEMAQIPEAVQKLYDGYCNSEPPLEALKLALKPILLTFKETFLLIDALDECPTSNGVQQQLCEMLVEISNSSIPGLHMLATSRKETEIEATLSEIGTLIVVPIQNFEVDADIRLYVKSQIANEVKLRRWVEKVEIESALAAKSDGMFRWVFCQIQALKKCRSPNEILHTLKTLPTSLDETYERILEGIDEIDYSRAASALRWLVFSSRPLRVEELAEASIVNPDNDTLFDAGDRFENPGDILQVLSSLVVTSSEARENLGLERSYNDKNTVKVIRIAHFSVQEYLLSNRIPSNLAQCFRIEEFSSQQIMAKSCLLYIGHYDAATSRPPTKDDLETYPILDYSGKHWADHVRACENSEYASTDLVCQFLNSESWLRTWTRIREFIDTRLFSSYSAMASPLYWAVCLKLMSVSRNLINSNADVNARGGICGNALQAACDKGYEAMARLLLEKGAEANAQGGHCGNALQAACRGGHEAIVRLLLEKGANINAKGGYWGNALQAAVYFGNKDMVRFLLKKGADINAQGGYSGNAVAAACLYGEDMISLLLENGADINQGGRHDTPLQTACSLGFEDLVRFLLKKGARVNTQGGEYGNALRAACCHPNEAIVRLLIENGAHVNTQGGVYGNALQAALEAGSWDRENALSVLQVLLENGADFDAKDDDRMTLAALVKDYRLLAELLLPSY